MTDAPPRRGRSLTGEDRALWNRVARTTTPLRRSAPDQAPTPSTNDLNPGLATIPDRLSPAARIGKRAVAGTPAHRGTASRMDAATRAKMVRGKLRPEGRLDLHGKTVPEAHPALVRFVQTAHAGGKRLVLVITGKGKDRDTGGPVPVRRGVLRHQVPRWLRTPPLSPLVLESCAAHRRHGGDGAIYVYLRRRRQTPPRLGRQSM